MSCGTGAEDPLETTHICELNEILVVVEEFCVLG
jgi:hypothetical protein